jgi:hypothetical protein
MKSLPLVLAAVAVWGAAATTGASAMPVAPIQTEQTSNTEQVRWVCNYYGRCWWRPNYYGYYGYPRYRYYGYPRYRYWRRW